MKRCVSIFVILTFIASLWVYIPSVSAASDTEDVGPNVAYITPSDGKDIAAVTAGNDESPEIVTKDGSTAWNLNNQNSKYYNLYFDISDSFLKEINDGTEVKVEIEYYSSNDGYFQFSYDSVTKSERAYKTIDTGKDDMWRTAEITLDDAYFGNRINGKYDMKIDIVTPYYGYRKVSLGSVPIRKIKVTKYPAKNPITHYGRINESGNIFPYYQKDKIIYNDFTNTTGTKLSADVTYRAVNFDGLEAWSKSDKIELEPYETKTYEVNVDSEYCQLYIFYVDVVNKDANIDSHYKRFDFAIVKTDPDGIKNKGYYLNPHFEYYYDDLEDAVDVLAKSNTYGVRVTFGWSDVEKGNAVGIFNYPSDLKRTHETLRKNNLHMLTLFGFSCAAYTGGFMYLPETDASLKRWGEAVEYVMEQGKGVIDRIEIWNEPNIGLFNGGVGGTSTVVRTPPEGYGKAAIVACEAAHKVDPNVEVGVMSICDVGSGGALSFFRRAMSTGLYNYCDAITLHPYGNKPTEDVGFAGSIKKYREILKDEFGVDKDMAIWNTEIGHSLADAVVDGSRELHSDYNVRDFLYLHGEDLAQAHVEYNFSEKGLSNPDRESRFGIVTSCTKDISTGDSMSDEFDKPFVARKAYVDITGMNYLLANSESDHNGNYAKSNGSYIYKYKSDKFNKDILSLWKSGSSENVTLDLGINEIEYSDSCGNITKLYSDNGKYTFVLSDRPFYLLGNFSKTEVTDGGVFEFPSGMVKAAKGDLGIINIRTNIDADNLKIDAEMPNVLTAQNDCVFEKNEAVCKFRVGDTSESGMYTRFRVYRDDKCVAMADIPIEIFDTPISASFSVHLTDGKSVSDWSGRVELTNYSNENVVKGKIKIIAPDEFTQISASNFGRIPKGKTSALDFRLPKGIKVGIYNVEYEVETEDGRIYNYIDKADFTVARKRKNEIKIDGIVEDGEWDGAAWFVADSESDVYYINSRIWGGKDDCSAKVAVMWDEDYFYLCGDVTDDVHYNSFEPGVAIQGDSIQFGLFRDFNQYIAAGNAGTKLDAYTAALASGGSALYKYNTQTDDTQGGLVSGNGCEVQVVRSQNKTCYEVKMPWNVMFGVDYTPEVGGYLGFAYAVNDNDGTADGRKSAMIYGRGLIGGYNTSLFSKMRFVE